MVVDPRPAVRPLADALLAGVLARAVRLLAGTSVRWVGGRPDDGHGEQRVYFANHTSHLDAVVLWAALPPGARAWTRPVAARDYWDAGPVRRRLAAGVLRAVLIDRHHVCAHARNPLSPLLDALADGRDSLLLFPEGTRGPGPEAGPFKGGLFHLARLRPDVTLVPVFLENLHRVLPRGALLPVPRPGGISFGAPVRLGLGEDKARFLERAREAVNRLGRA